MLKELVKLANHLDSKGLVKEADYLDRIIKSADAIDSVTNIGSKALALIDLNSNPSDCAFSTARAMATMLPHERANLGTCSRKGAEFHPTADKAEIVRALDRRRADPTNELDIDTVLHTYVNDLAKKGLLTADVWNQDHTLFSTIVSNSPFDLPQEVIGSLIAAGVNLASKPLQAMHDRTEGIIEEASRGTFTNQRGLDG